jgi:hypothetical protein
MTDFRLVVSFVIFCAQEPAFRKAEHWISDFVDNPRPTTFVVNDDFCQSSSVSRWYFASSQRTRNPTTDKSGRNTPPLECVDRPAIYKTNTLTTAPITRFDHL